MTMPPERLRELIDAFYAVYNYYGYGLMESVYCGGLEIELRDRGFKVEREVWIDVCYKGRFVGKQRVDMIVDDSVIVESKAAERLPINARSQLTTYLAVTQCELGLLLHFGPVPAFEKLIHTNKRR